MRIGIITDSIDGKGGGIGVYVYNLIKNLNIIDKENKYYLIHYMRTDLDIYKSNKEIVIHRPKIPLKSAIWRYGILPRKLRNQGIDLIHDPYEIGPLSFDIPFKKIITIHDVTPLLFPKLYGLIGIMLHKILYKKTVRNVDKIITCSTFSKKDIIKYLKVSQEKIKVIYNAADEKFKPLKQKEIIEVRQKYNLGAQFILYVGLLHPRKNIPSLIKAYHKLKKEGMGNKLVIAGKRSGKYKEIFKTVERLNLQKNVIFTGYVPDEDLPALYNAADLFVYPSLYEGFGLPPLEAMACGTPVITSNTSSLPEVVGNAGIMIDPYDVDGLAKAMYKVLRNDRLRDDMIKKGLKRAKMFSWEKAAKETLDVYEEICSH